VEPQNKRVYITRNKAVKRKIQNEIEIVSILKDNDFLIVAMEELSFYEQYKLVAESDVLISLHGAGLTHMLWMAANSKVMEIRLKDDTHNNCYFSLASDLNLKYFYTLAEKTHEQLSTQDTDFIVDVDDFNLSIQELLKA
jgi:capsular polysaccharide biosynthesis protein